MSKSTTLLTDGEEALIRKAVELATRENDKGETLKSLGELIAGLISVDEFTNKIDKLWNEAIRESIETKH